MVHPGMEFPDDVAPSEELLQLRPYFKLVVYGLAVIFAVEVLCGMYSAALIDLATLLPASILLKQDVGQLVRNLVPVSMLSSLNLVWQVVMLLGLLSKPPGPGNFFKLECKVADPEHPTESHYVNLCSASTLVGHMAVCSSVVLQLLCARVAWRMAKSMRQALWTSALLNVELPAAHRQAPSSETQGFTPYAGPAYHLGGD